MEESNLLVLIKMDIEIIEERPVNLSELKARLDEVKKRDDVLNFRANKAKDYVDTFSNLDIKKAKDIEKKINELNIARIKDKHIAKIIDLMPRDIDILKSIFSGENVTLKQEDLAQILEVLS